MVRLCGCEARHWARSSPVVWVRVWRSQKACRRLQAGRGIGLLDGAEPDLALSRTGAFRRRCSEASLAQLCGYNAGGPARGCFAVARNDSWLGGSIALPGVAVPGLALSHTCAFRRPCSEAPLAQLRGYNAEAPARGCFAVARNDSW